jgi:D-amino peptidase
MRFYISADIEGIAGVVSRENLSPGRFEFEAARDWMTTAVLSACEVLRDAGATEIVVSDSHGTGQNLRFERMPADVQLVRSWPRPLGMMQGIEVGSYEGALLIGYHAGATSLEGGLAHTMSGELFQEVRLNGRVVSETGVSAAIAGHFGTPVLFLSGDDAAVAEARQLLGEIATAEVKTTYGFLSARHLSPAAADEVLRAGVRDAVGLVGQHEPFVVPGPVIVEIRLRTRFIAEWLSYLAAVERIDAFTIRHVAADIVAASRFFQFLTSARAALA